MSTERQNFSNRKSQWKKTTSKLYQDIEKFLVRVRAGEIITMGDVFALAHRINHLGERSTLLARDAASLYMREHVLQEIQTNAHLLEVYSRQLYDILMYRKLPTTHYPLFTSALEYDTVVTEDPQESLARIMGGIDEEAN